MRRFGTFWTLALAALLCAAILAMPSNAEARDHRRSRVSFFLSFGDPFPRCDRFVFVRSRFDSIFVHRRSFRSRSRVVFVDDPFFCDRPVVFVRGCDW